jgi:hypothetical protein
MLRPNSRFMPRLVEMRGDYITTTIITRVGIRIMITFLVRHNSKGKQ